MAGEDPLSGDHSRQVVRGGLPTDQDHRLCRSLRCRRVEDDVSHRRPWGGGHPGRDHLVRRGRRERREHELGELRPGDPLQRLVEVEDALIDELTSDDESSGRRSLADPGLEHPQLAALDGELDVAQVAVVVLEEVHVAEELVEAALVELLQLRQRDGVVVSGDDVLALRVDQVVAVHAALPGRGVAGERDTGAGGVAEVAVDHRHDVDGGPEAGGDAFLMAIRDGALGVPGREDRANRGEHLHSRVLREGPPRGREHDSLELLDDLLQGRHGQFGLGGHADVAHRSV